MELICHILGRYTVMAVGQGPSQDINHTVLKDLVAHLASPAGIFDIIRELRKIFRTSSNYHIGPTGLNHHNTISNRL